MQRQSKASGVSMFRHFPLMALTFACVMLPALTSAAEGEIPAPTSPWKNNIELGAVQTSGNTHTTTLNAKAKSVYDADEWRTTATGSAVGSSANKVTTTEKYNAGIQTDWKFSKRDYIFVRGSFESDRFAGFKRRTSETVGYGRQLIKTDTFDWKAEIGGGLRQAKLTDRTTTSEAIARAASNVAWQFSEASKLSEDISSEGGAKGWTSKSVTALQTALNAHLASKISLTLDHNSKVPAGTKKLDIETAITLVVNF